jgi:predicted nucleotidyltransferase
MILQKLRSANLIHPPRWLVDQTQYLTVMGSVSYGVSGDTSDVDVYGFCVPPKDLVFPHLAGEIPGFGTQIQKFDQWQQHHVQPPDGRETTYDFQVFGIVRYFQLCMECNPNMIDSLFTPRRCVMHSTQIGELVRENRKMFLHKGAWHKFRGYAYSQMHKIKGKVNSSNPDRAETIKKHGYDVKFAYHVVRLLDEIEQIMVEQDLDLERNREQLKAIRRGEWTLEQIERHFEAKERALENTYATSSLRHSPDEPAIKALLMQCLEMHFGSIQDAVRREPSVDRLVRDIQDVLARHAAA